jgi:tetratricopeptide (TPR) repeat protein
MFHDRGTSTSTPALPEIDLSRASPEAATSIRTRLEALRQSPHEPSAWGWLGALLWAYDFRAPARVCLAEAGRLEPSNPRWPYYHALSLVIATPNEALPYFKKTVALCGNKPPAPRLRLAQLLAEQGRWPEARRECEPLLSDQPDFAPALLLSARAAHHEGRIDEAILLARRCLENPLTAKSAYLLLGTLFRVKGDMAGATTALARAAVLRDAPQSDPFVAEVMMLRGDPRLLCEQAHPLLAAGQLKEAEMLIERLRSGHPDYLKPGSSLDALSSFVKPERSDRIASPSCENGSVSAQGHFQLGLHFFPQIKPKTQPNPSVKR